MFAGPAFHNNLLSITDPAFLICYTYYFAHLLLLPEICCWLRLTITKAKRKRDIFQYVLENISLRIVFFYNRYAISIRISPYVLI